MSVNKWNPLSEPKIVLLDQTLLPNYVIKLQKNKVFTAYWKETYDEYAHLHVNIMDHLYILHWRRREMVGKVKHCKIGCLFYGPVCVTVVLCLYGTLSALKQMFWQMDFFFYCTQHLTKWIILKTLLRIFVHVRFLAVSRPITVRRTPTSSLLFSVMSTTTALCLDLQFTIKAH